MSITFTYKYPDPNNEFLTDTWAPWWINICKAYRFLEDRQDYITSMGGHYGPLPYTLIFENKEDATAFILKWG
jgi:hypothetical protein